MALVAVPIREQAFVKGRAQLFVAAAGTTLPVIDTSTDGSVCLVQQTVTLKTGASGGTFTLAYNGQVTSGIAYNAAASAITTALNALSTLGSGQVTTTGAGPWVVSFIGSIGQAGHTHLLVLDETSITGGSGSGTVTRVREFLGWTEGDLKFEIKEDFEEFEVNDEYGPVDDAKKSESGSITGVLAEGTLVRFSQALSSGTYTTTNPGSSQAGYEKLTFGGAAAEAFKQVIVKGENRAGKAHIWLAHLCRRVGDAGPAFKKGGKTMVPFKAVLRTDPTQSAGAKLAMAWNITDNPTS